MLHAKSTIRFRKANVLFDSIENSGILLRFCSGIGVIANINDLEPQRDPGMIRTCDLWFRKPSLYPTELRGLRASRGINTTVLASERENKVQLVGSPPCPPVACLANPVNRREAEHVFRAKRDTLCPLLGPKAAVCHLTHCNEFSRLTGA